MNFLITGTHFRNRGAELMLMATMAQIKQWDSANTLAMSCQIGRWSERHNAGLYHFIRYNRHSAKKQWAYHLIKMIPTPIRHKLRLMLEEEIDVILDASGFAYSDQWPAETLHLELYRDAKKNGKKVVLLPQAFGPFKGQAVKSIMAGISENADLIFAREDVSHHYLKTLLGNPENLRVAPDFTNLLPARHLAQYAVFANRPCVVPNYRMLDKTRPEIKERYLAFLVESLRYMRHHGLEPFLLLHEVDDLPLGQIIIDALAHPIPLVTHADPQVLKGILGQASFVISSRYHALISALCQGVPCIATGWSHKYQMLMQSYQCEELLVNLEDEAFSPLDYLMRVMEDTSSEHYRQQIQRVIITEKQYSEAMWEAVRQVIHGSAHVLPV